MHLMQSMQRLKVQNKCLTKKLKKKKDLPNKYRCVKLNYKELKS